MPRPVRRPQPGALMASLALLVSLALALTSTVSPAHAQSLSGFVSPGPLASDHADLDSITKCTACHVLGGGVSDRKCLDCHDTVAAQVDNAVGFHANLGSDCASCHSDHQGRDFALIQLHKETFNHQQTGFALQGKHKPLECVDCHTAEPDYTGLQSDCSSCHEEPHGVPASTRTVLNQCRLCHDAEAWDTGPIPTSVFDHSDPEDADFALHGRHQDVACGDCHAESRFVPTDGDACTDCHEDIHRGQFKPRDCTACHDETQKKFRIPRFDHTATRWALDGAHEDVSCATCHGSGARAVYRPREFARCDDCHDDVHEGQFAPRDCDACHSNEPGGFTEGVIDHDQTDFPLRNEHESVACVDCHGEGPTAVFADLPAEDCSSCHDDAHAGRFEGACTDCHTDGVWGVDGFDHGLTDWALTGAHADASCVSCHGEGESRKLAGLPFGSCLDCHEQEDPHKELPPESCTDCHVTDAWAEVTFDHAATGFALVGLHEPVACLDCHEDPSYRGAKTDCESCHAADEPEGHYEGTCGSCHEPTGWGDAQLAADAHARTGFALLGAHARVGCADCHGDGSPNAAASGECIDCHASDDPHRNQLGDACDDCHNTTEWFRTSFRHGQTGFVLEGVHRAAACDDCHATGFAGTPDDCERCHRTEAPGDALHRDPLTRDCSQCHRPTNWDQADFSFGGTP